MADLLLFAQNLLELATLTVTSALATKPKERLVDRARGAQWEATAAAQQDLDADHGSAKASTAIGLVNHNLAGVTIEVFRGSSFPPATSIGTFLVNADPFYASWNSVSDRYQRVRIPAFASAPAIGELMIGVPGTVTRKPVYDGGVRRALVGNVRRRETPGGYVRKAKLGSRRVRLIYGWDRNLPDADLTTLEAAFAELDDSVKNLLVQDIGGTWRWMEFVRATLESANVSHGRHGTELELLEAL